MTRMVVIVALMLIAVPALAVAPSASAHCIGTGLWGQGNCQGVDFTEDGPCVGWCTNGEGGIEDLLP